MSRGIPKPKSAPTKRLLALGLAVTRIDQTAAHIAIGRPGERDQALATLSAALKAGYSLKEIKNEPELVALRTDTRYQVLLAGQPAK